MDVGNLAPVSEVLIMDKVKVVGKVLCNSKNDLMCGLEH